MRAAVYFAVLFGITSAAWPQAVGGCSCGAQKSGPPESRELHPYAGAPDDLRPFSRFTVPYYEHYTRLIEYNGPGREAPVPALKDVNEVRIGFLGPIKNHPDEALGKEMLHGAMLAIEEANAAGGYCGKPFRLMIHNDQAVWGQSSNEVVKMVYDDKVWAMFGSISADSTHIALRVALKAEVPIVNSASTDPTIPETIIPWYLTVIQDDRVQSYTLARRIYTELGLERVAILRINDRYGRFGVLKFKDASRRLGHPVVIEQKYMQGDTDFTRQLRVINDSRVDAVVLWGDAAPAGAILKQMRGMGMKQRAFGSFRVLGDDLFKHAGEAAEGLEVVFPYNPSRADDPQWRGFNQRYESRFSATPDSFASLAYDSMRILLDSICRAGLNRALIRDALTGLQHYRGVTGDMVFDPNCKNVAPMYLGVIRGGRAEFRRYPMHKPYAKAGDGPAEYTGPPLPDLPAGERVIAVFGPNAAQVPAIGAGYRLVGIDSETSWGKASSELIRVLYDPHTVAVIATGRKSSHLALQLGNKIQVPVIAISDDTSLTTLNIPWIFRLPSTTPLAEALEMFQDVASKATPNRAAIQRALASRFAPGVEPREH